MESQSGLSASARSEEAVERAASRGALHCAGPGGGWNGARYRALFVEGSGRVMRLRPARRRTAFLLTTSLAFTAIGVAMLFSGEGIAGWFVGLFFGVCSAAFAIHLSPGASYLQLSSDGFVT